MTLNSPPPWPHRPPKGWDCTSHTMAGKTAQWLRALSASAEDPGFSSQHPHVSHNPLTSIPGSEALSWLPQMPGVYMGHMQANTHMHKTNPRKLSDPDTSSGMEKQKWQEIKFKFTLQSRCTAVIHSAQLEAGRSAI